MYKISDEAVQKNIKAGLVAYKKLAKYRLKEIWKSLSVSERGKSARSLVLMNDVAKDPKRYFSRAKTEGAWKERGAEYAKKHSLEHIDYAFYFVEGPKEIVWNKASAAMRYPLIHQYYHFLNYIQNYEYSDTDFEKERFAKEIEKDSKRVCALVDIIESKPIIKQWKQFKSNFINLSR